MNNQIKSIFFIFLFSLAPMVYAFEGEVLYDIVQSPPASGNPKSQLKISMANDLMRIDYIFNFLGRSGLTTAFLDYKAGIGIFVKNKKEEKVNLRENYKNKQFLVPEELIKTGNTKIISDAKTEEYETFYFAYKNRYSLKSWYSTQTFPGTYYPVWHLFSIHPDMSLANFLINPVNHQISYEIGFERGQGKKTIYQLVKIQRKTFDKKHFKP